MTNRTVLRLCVTVTLACLLMATAAVQVAIAEGTSPAPEPALLSMEANLLGLLNGERAQLGVPALQVDDQLEALARQRSQDMADRGYFSRVTPEGSMVFDVMNEMGIPYQLAGGNLAHNSASPQDSPSVAHKGFMGSPAHAQDDHNPQFNRVGIGVAQASDGSTYFTELFAEMN